MLLDSEDKFSKMLVDDLDNTISIIKSTDKYCPVDFILLNRYNLKHIYLEHKKRNIVSTRFPSIWIKVSKVRMILNTYGNFIFVSECLDRLLFLYITNDIFNNDYLIETNDFNGEVVLNISTSDFSVGLPNLVRFINQNI